MAKLNEERTAEEGAPIGNIYAADTTRDNITSSKRSYRLEEQRRLGSGTSKAGTMDRLNRDHHGLYEDVLGRKEDYII